jgi:serine/threonine-protein kinase
MKAIRHGESLIGQVLEGKYRIDRLLGEGGMGSVYAAHHEITKNDGAFKLLHPSYSERPDAVERFIREASASGLIQNPHIVKTLDAGRLKTGEPYMFMELLKGMSLDRLLEARKHLRPDEVAAIVVQAAEALQAAHDAGIVHRDIKPANLFLVEGSSLFVKVLDFGISKFAPQHEIGGVQTTEGQLLGTAYYMSPEQLMGRTDIDARTDIFSLGVMMYEMLAGRRPFDDKTLAAINSRIFNADYEPISKLRAEVPPALDDLLRRALAAQRESRFQSASDFRAQVVALLGKRADSFAPTMSEHPSAPVTGPYARVIQGGGEVRAAAVPRPGTPATSDYAEVDTVAPIDSSPRSLASQATGQPVSLASSPRRGERRLLLVTVAAAIAGGLSWWLYGANAPEDPGGDSASTPSGNPGNRLSSPVRDAPAAAAIRDPSPALPAPAAKMSPTAAEVMPGRQPASGASESKGGQTPAQRDGLSETNPFSE